MSGGTKKQIGSILLQQKAVSARELEAALKKGQKSTSNTPLVSRLTQEGIIRETEALKALSEQAGCPGIDLNQICIRLADLDFVPLEHAQAHHLLPVLVKGERMFVAMANPADRRVVAELELMSGKSVFPYIALKATLRRVVAEAYQLKSAGRRHFVGPSCPPDTLAKAGVSVIPPPLRTEAEVAQQQVAIPRASQLSEESMQPSTGEAQPRRSAVIVDDAMAAAASQDYLSEPSFEQSSPPVAGPETVPRSSGERTMLVVDDEVDVRNMVARIFADRGYRVIEADRGDLALQSVRDNDPDVLILDAMLPMVHGFEVAKQLKNSDRYQHIPIVMVSAIYRGWRFAEDIKNNYKVNAFLEKPFRIREIVELVEEVMSASSPRAAEATSNEAEPHLTAGMEAYKAGNIDVAIEHMHAGIQVDPLAFKVHFHLGLLYGKKGQLYDAIQELETAVNIRADYFPALKNLAVLYQNAGFRNKAIEMWERCLAASPDEATRQTIKRHLVAVL